MFIVHRGSASWLEVSQATDLVFMLYWHDACSFLAILHVEVCELLAETSIISDRKKRSMIHMNWIVITDIISCRLPRFRWDVIWLPFGPLRYIINLFVSLCCACKFWSHKHSHVQIGLAVELESPCMWIIYLMNHRKK